MAWTRSFGKSRAGGGHSSSKCKYAERVGESVSGLAGHVGHVEAPYREMRRCESKRRVETARLKRKGRRPLQGQKRIQTQSQMRRAEAGHYKL